MPEKTSHILFFPFVFFVSIYYYLFTKDLPNDPFKAICHW